VVGGFGDESPFHILNCIVAGIPAQPITLASKIDFTRVSPGESLAQL
jgi:hypothetical protein